jgi:non-specific serine/threonine protein kinase
VTLVGPGGVGKTRLALRVADFQAADLRDDVISVELGAIAEPSLVARALASALQHRDEGSVASDGAADPLIETLGAAIGPRDCLILLDNCEHVLDAVAALVDRLLRACPRLRILATSREPIAVDGETVWRVLPLALGEEPAPADPAEAGCSDAARLFLDRARAASPQFGLSPETASVVELICRRLDGIPLAIELAAARLRGLPLDAIADSLDNCYGLLTSGSRTAPARHQTLRALVDWSFDLLTEPERKLFRRLAVFASGFSLAAAEAVAEIEGRGLDLLPRLVEKSLVVLEQQGGQPRFRLLDTLREYAGEKLREAGEEQATRLRYLTWCRRLAERAEAGLRTAEHDAWIARLGQEHDNLRRAISWGLAESDDDSAPRIVGALVWFWEVRGHHVEATGYLEQALGLVESGSLATSPEVRARLLNGLALFTFGCGEYRRAVAYAHEALALCRELGDDWGTCLALETLGFVAQFDGDSDRAAELLGESMALAERHGDRLNAAHSLYALGVIEHGRGNYERASELYTRSLGLWRSLGAAAKVAQSMTLLARMVHLRGDDARAARLLEESLGAARAAGSPRAVGWALLYLGHIMRARGDLDRADALYIDSLDQRAVIGERRGIAQCLEALAAVAAIRASRCSPDRARGQSGRAETARHASAARAATLFGASEALREAISAFILPCERGGYARDVASVRASLGSEIGEHWSAGRVLLLDDTLTLARAVRRDPAGGQRAAVLTLGEPGGSEEDAPSALSRREREVIILIARGLTSRQIADELSIAKRTADTHASNIMNKLGVSSRRDVAVWAVEHGLLQRARPVAIS